MKTIKVNKTNIVNSINKIVFNKSLVRSYLRGEITKEQLELKGIKFAKPI